MSNKFLQYDSAAGDLSDVYARINTNSDTIEAHIADTNNPHLVTLNELGGISNPLTAILDTAAYELTNTATISGNGTTDVDVKNTGGTVRLSGDAVRLSGTTVILDTDLDMNQNVIDNCLVVNNQLGQPLNLVGGSNVSAIILDATPTQGIIIGTNVGASADITGDTSLSLRSNTGSIDLFPSTQMNVVIGGMPRFAVDASEVNVGNNLNMNTQDITNASVIVRQSNGNLIDFDVGGGLELQSGVGNNIDIKAGSDTAQISGANAVLSATGVAAVQGGTVSIGETISNMSLLFQSSAVSIQQGLTNIASFTPTRISFLQNLDMNNNNILNTGDVALTSINTNVIYVPDGIMPTSFVADRTYIFLGSRSTVTPIVLPAGAITLKGTSRENSTIEYTGSGALFTSTDQNLTIQDLGWSCTNSGGYFLDATNAAKDKLLTIQNCEFREAYQVMEITGYDLVDFQNNVLTYIRSGALGPSIGVNCIDVSKLEINSCEFIRWYQFGQPANTNPFAGNMIDISGSNGASQITNNIIHPRVAQNGIDIDAAAIFGAGVNITGNTFVDEGLTSGVILDTNSNADYDEKGITEANTLLPNLKTRVGAQLSAANTITTATSATPADINLNNLLVPFSSFGVLVGTGGGVTYNRTRPVNFQVTYVANLQAVTGGANQRIGLTVSKNGVNTGINSFVNLDSAGTEPKTVTLTLVGDAVQGDVFRSQLVNTSTSSNITCTDLIVSGVEI